MTTAELDALDCLLKRYFAEHAQIASTAGVSQFCGISNSDGTSDPEGHHCVPGDGTLYIEFVCPGVGSTLINGSSLEDMTTKVKQWINYYLTRERQQHPKRTYKPYQYPNEAWSRRVRERDGRCLLCGATKNLVAHHIKPKRTHPELRNDDGNGITLCRECHGRTIGREYLYEERLTQLVAGA
jgi:5-methylcytosine-specific restriction endonuclease McrA